jgi:hypothetical protein
MEQQIGFTVIWIAPACTGGIPDAGVKSTCVRLLSCACGVLTPTFRGTSCLQHEACGSDFVSAPDACAVYSSIHSNSVTRAVSSSDSRDGP